MDYEKIVSSVMKYGSTPEKAVKLALGVAPERVREDVILAPWWEPGSLGGFTKAEPIADEPIDAIRVWDVEFYGRRATYIKTGIGASVLIDPLLSLGLTPAKRVIFIGSAGALSSEIRVGDMIVPRYSVCGDGASRYIAGDSFTKDVLLEKAYPDEALNGKLYDSAARVAKEMGLGLRWGNNFSIDTIFAQFAHIDEITALGCDIIEMETACAFRAAKLMGIAMAALFLISDNTVENKSLMGGVPKEEDRRRRAVRREAFLRIIAEALS